MSTKLGFNIDHVATLRNARGEGYPNIIRAAKEAINAGADHITAHLREDRRHIKDQDIYDLKNQLNVPLNMELAPTQEMIEIACKIQPYAVCLVPERREELTTEGGLNIKELFKYVLPFIKLLKQHQIKVTLFLDAEKEQIFQAFKLPIDAIEINTAKYSNSYADFLIDKNNKFYNKEIEKVYLIANLITQNGLEAHAGHGLNYYNINEIAKILAIKEFNIGHFLVSESVFIGLNKSIKRIIKLIKNARK